MKTIFKSTGKFKQEADYPIRDLDEICGNCDEILGKHNGISERCTEPKNISSKRVLSSRSSDYWKGFDFACELLDEMYAKTHPHPHNIADCLKAKVNKLAKGKVRKNGR